MSTFQHLNLSSDLRTGKQPQTMQITSRCKAGAILDGKLTPAQWLNKLISFQNDKWLFPKCQKCTTIEEYQQQVYQTFVIM